VPTLVDQAVVLRVWDFSETSQTVSLLGRARGLVRGLAKGAHREKSKFGGGFEPLTLGEVVYAAKPSAELVALTEWDLSEVFWGVRRDLAAHRAGLYMADLVNNAILDHDPHERLFDAMVHSLRSLDDAARVHETLMRFQWRLLTEVGYRPRLDGNIEGVGADRTFLFRPAAGGITENGAGRGWRVRAETVRALASIDDANNSDRQPVATSVAERAGRLLSEYLRHVLGKDLSSRQVCFGAGLAETSTARDPNKV
jgi:DNA repair protein RecO (recombination protein O)